MRHVTDTSTDPPKPTGDRRTLAIVLALVAAACLIVAAFSKSWMGNPGFSGLVRDRDGNASRADGRYDRFQGDIRFGPLGFEQCAKPFRGFDAREAPAAVTCRALSIDDFNDEVAEAAGLDRDKYTSSAFPRAGKIALAACLLSAAGLLVSAALAFARIRKDLPISPASVTLLGLVAAMAAGCVFVATKPGPAGMLGVDLGFGAFGIGAVVGILGAQLLAKQLRPPDPDLLAGAMSPDDFAFPVGKDASASAPVPVPLPAIPPTQPVESLSLEPPAAAAVDSPGAAKKPDDVSS